MQLSDLNNNVNVTLSKRQEQIVLGTLLGNGHLAHPKRSKNCHLVVRQPKKQGVNWFACKVAELKNLGRCRAIQEDKYNWIWTSISNPCWAHIYNICYKDGKKYVSESWLNEMAALGLMTFFCDKGCLNEDNLSLIKVGHLGDEFPVIADYFNKFYDMSCFIDGNILKFDNLGTQRLVATIQHCLPKYMYHLLNLA